MLSAALVQAEPQRPNIIVILVDDMGYSDLGVMGSEIRTPNLDALAETGVLMTHLYPTARCSPSRASLLTGQYPHAMNGRNELQGVRMTPAPDQYRAGSWSPLVKRV
jgi:arylsulfatase